MAGLDGTFGKVTAFALQKQNKIIKKIKLQRWAKTHSLKLSKASESTFQGNDDIIQGLGSVEHPSSVK